MEKTGDENINPVIAFSRSLPELIKTETQYPILNCTVELVVVLNRGGGLNLDHVPAVTVGDQHVYPDEYTLMPERGFEDREVGTAVDESLRLGEHRFEIEGDLNRVGCAVELLSNGADLTAGGEQ